MERGGPHVCRRQCRRRRVFRPNVLSRGGACFVCIFTQRAGVLGVWFFSDGDGGK
ncbi:hypothetical protein BDW68DRAFT_166787 [Aspergillus falconensis]